MFVCQVICALQCSVCVSESEMDPISVFPLSVCL